MRNRNLILLVLGIIIFSCKEDDVCNKDARYNFENQSSCSVFVEVYENDPNDLTAGSLIGSTRVPAGTIGIVSVNAQDLPSTHEIVVMDEEGFDCFGKTIVFEHNAKCGFDYPTTVITD